MKTFKFDIIISEEDMCDRWEEMDRLISVMKRRGRIVIYSIRRMGKTSLMTVASKRIREKDPKAFHLYVDLNEVTSLNDVAARFRSHFELALKEHFPLQKVKSYINELLSRISVGLPGGIELSLEKYAISEPEQYLLSLFRELSDLSLKYNVVLIVDEFQGIAGLKDAQALLRREFQKLSNTAIVLMGSNQRLLYQMFNDKKLPFFGFGEDLELQEISIGHYLPYLNERFARSNLVIPEGVAAYMLAKMNNIPNYINELGAWIVDTMSSMELTKGHVDEALESATRSKRGRYVTALYGYSVNKKKFIKAVAKLGRVKAYTSKEMQETTLLSPTELLRVKKSLEDCPILSRDTDNHLFIIDPFFRKFLETM